MWEGLQEIARVKDNTKRKPGVDLGRDRRNEQLLLIRQRRTTARMNTTVLRISYLLKLLRSAPRKSKVIQTSEEHQLSLQVTSRKQQIQWPPSDDKRWESFDENLDKILGSTLMGDVHRKLSSLSTIVYAVGQERFGLVKTRDGKEADIINKPNQRQLEIQKLRTEINSINKQYRKARNEEKEGLRQLRFILREKKNHLQKAERIKKARKERSRKRCL